jgi:hypothetical protein
MSGTLYLFDNDESLSASESIIRLKQRFVPTRFHKTLPVYTSKEFSQLITRIRQIHTACVVDC